MAWTDGTDRATGYVVTAAVWNALLGATGSLMYLKTKCFSVPVTALNDSGSDVPIFTNIIVPNAYCGTGDFAQMGFYCPDDYASLVESKVMCCAVETNASLDLDIYTINAATGEVYDTHSDSDTTTTYNVTFTENFEVDISDELSTMAAGDWVGVKILNSDTTSFMVFGLFIRYLVGT